MSDSANETGGADHRQAHGDGLLRLKAEDVDEDRDSQDGSAAAQEPEGKTHQESESQAEYQHGRHRRASGTPLLQRERGPKYDPRSFSPSKAEGPGLEPGDKATSGITWDIGPTEFV